MEAKKLSMPQPLPFQLSLRVRHPSMDPAELSRELGLEADHSFRAGDPRRSMNDTQSLHGESYWLGSLDPTSWPAGWLSGLGHAEVVDKGLQKAVTRSLSSFQVLRY
jgi:hypothetical protein